jgi:hypothetical protein
MLKLTGTWPPDVFNWYAYPWFTTPFARTGGVVIFRGEQGWGLMVKVNALSSVKASLTREAARQLSLTLRVKFHVPKAVGTPDREPEAFMFKPGGNVPDTILNDIGNCPPSVVN